MYKFENSVRIKKVKIIQAIQNHLSTKAQLTPENSGLSSTNNKHKFEFIGLKGNEKIGRNVLS